ncbi:ATP-binding protein [Ignavibacterium sp.]|uniref:ATP-binding protein n=1 Tax=Ignavibacterium sp. TaxID=2651167 RepID=UPI00307D3247
MGKLINLNKKGFDSSGTFMKNYSQKLQLKLTIEFAIFFIIVAAVVYVFTTDKFETDLKEKFEYKASIFENYLEQNPQFFWTDSIDNKDLLLKLAQLNDAEYLVIENSRGKLIDAINLGVAEKYLYIRSDIDGGISQDNQIYRTAKPIYPTKILAGKFYAGFIAADQISKLQRIKLLTALFSLTILLTGIIITYILSLLSFRPIIAIINALDRTIKGNYTVKIKYEGKNELGLLVEKINDVLDELQQKIENNEKLDQKIADALRDKLSEVGAEISEQEAAKRILRKSEEQFKLLFENAPIGMVIISSEGRIMSVNKSFCDTLDYTTDELLGVPIKYLFEKDEIPFFITKNSKNESVIRISDINAEKKLIKKDGKEINVIVKSVGVEDDNVDIEHYIMQLLDITAIKRAQQELMKALERAEQSDKLKTAFLAQMSHEIRTPLNVILTSIPLFEDLIPQGDDEMKVILDSVKSAGKRLHRTIDMILNMSSVQSGNYKPHYESFSLSNDLKKLTEEFRSLIEDKGLTLNFTNLAGSTFITADRYTVNQIFQNLIGNAIKYTQKGFIDVILREQPNKKLKVEVRDTGIGMSKEYLQNIFTPFSQEHSGHKREYEGNGLGLALVKKYAEINHAEIHVESEKGKGSVFSVVFEKEIDISLLKNLDTTKSIEK